MDQNGPELTKEAGPGGSRIKRLSALLRGYILYFLDAIGVWEDHKVDRLAQLSKLRLYHTEFRKLLSANNSFLETLGDLENKRFGGEFFDTGLVRRKTARMLADIHSMIESLNAISGDRYPLLRDSLDRIGSALSGVMDSSRAQVESRLVMDMSEVSSIHADLVGGKMANIGEIMGLGLPTPGGMVVTTEGYRLLMETGGLRSWVQDKHVELESNDDSSLLSSTLQDRIMQLKVPPELEAAIQEGYDRYCLEGKPGCPVAVRSSAVGEDSEFSFAGQFLSLLGISREDLAESYLRVLASLYSPEAVHYRRLQGISGVSAEMAVGFMPMVEARSSGVVFTCDPVDPDSGYVLIQAVRGIGQPLVDGRISPELLLVSRDSDCCEISRRASKQSFLSIPSPDGGLIGKELAADNAAIPCISDEEARLLARFALRLETHFGCPQDIEWAIDCERGPLLLQSRPFRLARGRPRAVAPLPGAVLIFSGGETACPGIGVGPAVHMNPDQEPESFPAGSVLVARRSSPRFVRLMSRASAILTDVGSTTGHMASLAREFQVPALLNTGIATRDIPPGMVVTVDAGNGFVYRGDISNLTAKGDLVKPVNERVGHTRPGPERRLLERVLELVSPLALTDPASPDFTPEKCRSLHDLARFVHEKSYREMFMLGDNVGDLKEAGCKLEVPLPIDLYIVDLGGGIKTRSKGTGIKPSQITSAPFAALINGMLNKKILSSGPRPMDMRGLFSIMMRHAVTSPEQEHSFNEPCYAIISDKYLNYTARVGYHFSVVDSYCGATPNKNYISLLFRGGAADFPRRERRTRAIGVILEKHGFSVEVSNDMVLGRLGKATGEETASMLEMIGMLFQFFRQMDAAMTDEESVSVYVNAFMSGDFGLEKLS